jgi:hypothetical protein
MRASTAMQRQNVRLQGVVAPRNNRDVTLDAVLAEVS